MLWVVQFIEKYLSIRFFWKLSRTRCISQLQQTNSRLIVKLLTAYLVESAEIPEFEYAESKLQRKWQFKTDASLSILYFFRALAVGLFSFYFPWLQQPLSSANEKFQVILFWLFLKPELQILSSYLLFLASLALSIFYGITWLLPSKSTQPF